MVDLAGLEKQVFKGKIVKVDECSLREYLTEKFKAKAPKIIKQFNEENIDREHIVLIVEQDSTEIDWFGMVPTARGWSKSNLKKVKDRNGLPDKTEQWIGKEIDLIIDAKGFMRVAT